jgi:hypothetical protein
MHSNRHSLSTLTALRRGRRRDSQHRRMVFSFCACAKVKMTPAESHPLRGSRPGCWTSSRKVTSGSKRGLFVVVSDHNLRYAGICGFGAMQLGNAEPVLGARPSAIERGSWAMGYRRWTRLGRGWHDARVPIGTPIGTGDVSPPPGRGAGQFLAPRRQRPFPLSTSWFHDPRKNNDFND